jgi:hypothetical protein
MRSSIPILILSACSVSLSSAMLLNKRVVNDPVNAYLSRMCLPLYSNITRVIELQLTPLERVSSLAFSPFPCEQEMYLQQVCTANGTTEADFLAEQQCLCGSDFFEVTHGCSACYFNHGYVDTVSPEQVSSQIESLQMAECSSSPPYQPYTNLFPTVNITSLSLSPSLTLGNDRFPNMTAVSNYFTATRSATPGSITGSATGRLTSWTNYSGIRYTPTSTPSQHAITNSTPTSTVSGASKSSSSSSAASSSAVSNSGSGGMVQVAGGFLAAGLGILVSM